MALQQRDDFVLWEGGPVPPGADGITIGRLVIVRVGRATPYLLRHEHVHVRQWRRHGAVGFLVRYLLPYAAQRLLGRSHRSAYLRIPFEIEADWVARRQLATGVSHDGDAAVDDSPASTR